MLHIVLDFTIQSVYIQFMCWEYCWEKYHERTKRIMPDLNSRFQCGEGVHAQ